MESTRDSKVREYWGSKGSCADRVAGLMAIDSKSNAKRVITVHYPFCVLPLSVTFLCDFGASVCGLVVLSSFDGLNFGLGRSTLVSSASVVISTSAVSAGLCNLNLNLYKGCLQFYFVALVLVHRITLHFRGRVSTPCFYQAFFWSLSLLSSLFTLFVPPRLGPGVSPDGCSSELRG